MLSVYDFTKNLSNILNRFWLPQRWKKDRMTRKKSHNWLNNESRKKCNLSQRLMKSVDIMKWSISWQHAPTIRWCRLQIQFWQQWLYSFLFTSFNNVKGHLIPSRLVRCLLSPKLSITFWHKSIDAIGNKKNMKVKFAFKSYQRNDHILFKTYQ